MVEQTPSQLPPREVVVSCTEYAGPSVVLPYCVRSSSDRIRRALDLLRRRGPLYRRRSVPHALAYWVAYWPTSPEQGGPLGSPRLRRPRPYHRLYVPVVCTYGLYLWPVPMYLRYVPMYRLRPLPDRPGAVLLPLRAQASQRNTRGHHCFSHWTPPGLFAQRARRRAAPKFPVQQGALCMHTEHNNTVL